MVKPWVSSLLLVGLLVSVAGCAAGGLSSATPTPLPQIAPAQQTVFTVERGPIISQQDVTGEIVPAHQEKLAFGTAGTVNRVLVNRGDRVKKGDLLAELKLDTLPDQLHQAQLDLQVAQQNLALDKLQKAYDLQQAQSDAVIAQKQAALAQIALDAAADPDKAAAQLNLEIAQENVKTAAAHLTLVTAQANATLDQDVQHSQNIVDSLNQQIAQRQLVAPYDGIVLVTTILPGLDAKAFTTAIVVGDLGDIVVQVPWEMNLANSLDASTTATLYPTKAPEPNYPVTFKPDFLPISSQQSATTATPSSDITGRYLYFTIPAATPREAVPVGNAVRLNLILGSKPDALLLSPAALRGTDAFSYVIVLDGDYHRRVEIVSIGIKTTDKWEVIGNLKAGDQVLGP